jgi:hypothetical protein
MSFIMFSVSKYLLRKSKVIYNNKTAVNLFFIIKIIVIRVCIIYCIKSDASEAYVFIRAVYIGLYSEAVFINFVTSSQHTQYNK